MLSLQYAQRGPKLCDGTTRRDFLKIGGLGLGGLSLAQLLQAEAQAGIKNSRKSVIMIYLVGGPPHQDLFDLKPDAPAEIAGPHLPIKTNVPGIEICELLPQLAQRMDKLVPIRSLCDAQSGHDAFQCYTGRKPVRNGGPLGGWPQFGSLVGKLQGQAERGIPPFVSLTYNTTHGPYNEPGPGFLGVGAAPFRVFDGNRDNMVLNGITPERLADRRSLLASMDLLRRELDATGKMAGVDSFNAQAMDVLTSSQLVDAIDLSKEDPRTVARYGTGDTTKMMDGNGAPRVPQSLLMARRLVEAGARVVTVNYSKWDWHGGTNAEGRADNHIFTREREDFPVFDNCVSALIDDLHERGLDKDCTVLIWGEFGRTPIISKQVGRDHWPRVACALMAGGGMRTGQVIGATDRLGGEPVERPVTFGEVFATLYHNLGIDVQTAQVRDLNGRPQYLVDDNPRPIRELI
jgi:uncharacterized protein (DUF1501 family)